MKLLERYSSTRKATENICSFLEIEDMVVQTCPEVSPIKWHLAHTSWFFDKMLLQSRSDYQSFGDQYDFYFNSYYKAAGNHWIQADRGTLSRPTVREILKYRTEVDEKICSHLEAGDFSSEDLNLLVIGLEHELQHQELMYMDAKNVLALSKAQTGLIFTSKQLSERKQEWVPHGEGLYEIGCRDEKGFAYDNERPSHKIFQPAFSISNALITCKEFLAFVEAGCYEDPSLWLSLGWDHLQSTGRKSPLYWFKDSTGTWMEYTLYGPRELDLDAPVCHVTYFEANAFAKWAGCRLPTEFEFEIDFLARNDKKEKDSSSAQKPEFSRLHPVDPFNTYGELWCWSQSAYEPYPGFKEFSGLASEYNGKFMCGQQVLRGGCVVTPQGHLRPTYRNFYKPEQSWMFSGIRIARDES